MYTMTDEDIANIEKLVEEKYSSQKMAYDMVNLYRKILEQ